MGESGNADQISLAGLPKELHGLLSFLEVDDRPAAIVDFSLGRSPNGVNGTVYRNAAWKHSLETADFQKHVDSFEHILKKHLLDGGNPESLRNAVSKNGEWDIRIWSNYCIAVVSDGQGTMRRDVDQAQQQDPTIHNDKSLDWTQDNISNPSPWIEYLRGVNWSGTSFGPMQNWSNLLRQCALSMMANPNPRLVIWGANMTFIYNEACVQLFGREHPRAMGADATKPWSDSWNTLRPLVEDGYRGESSRTDGLQLAIERNGYPEETYWDVTILPIISGGGDGIGVFCELTETTLLVTGERRRASIGTISEKVAGASTLPELWTAVLQGLLPNDLDVPYAMLYDVVDDTTDADCSSSSSTSTRSVNKKCVLAGTIGIARDDDEVCHSFSLAEHSDGDPEIVKPSLQAWKTRQPLTLSKKDGTMPPALHRAIEGRGFSDIVTEAKVLPINSATGNQVLGILVIGLNPRTGSRPEYNLWLHILVDFIEKAASLISLPQEQRRAKQIADDMVNSLAHQLRHMTFQVERSEAKFSRLAATAPTGMFMFDADGRNLYVNDKYLEMLGETREQHDSRRPEAKHWEDRVHEDDLDRFIATWDQITEKKIPITLEFRLKKPWKSLDKTTKQEISGETWLLTTAFPEIEADGSIVSIQGWLTNISLRKFSETLLEQRLKDALEHKVEAERFIDMTSHEMRNPLSAILQSADSIVESLNSAEATLSEDDIGVRPETILDIVDAAQTIILCAQHQKRIVDDVLTLSKLDADLLEISPDKTQLPMLVEKALKMFEAEIVRNGIDAKLLIEPTYDELNVDWVMLDPSRVLQIIINLLTNAIKFTRDVEERQIKICLGASYEKPTGKHHKVNFVPVRHGGRIRKSTPDTISKGDIYLQIGVYDTGKGLTEPQMKTLFERFQQGSPKTYKQYGGSGLGLFISRELCELQGGQIGVASGDGNTVFTFFIRAQRCLPDVADLKLERKISATKSFTSASASPIAYSRRGSVILGDKTNQMSTPIGEDGSVEQDFAPIARKRTLSPLARASTPLSLGALLEEQNTATSTNGHTARDMHVLLVEDNIINQKVLSQQLRRLGCTVHVANHGLECLDFLETSTYCAKDIPLSIILLDLEMPTMDGLTCIRRIRERQTQGLIKGHVPVIAVTANARSEQISLALEAGMDSVVTKPFRLPELVPQMEKLVAEMATAAAAASHLQQL